MPIFDGNRQTIHNLQTNSHQTRSYCLLTVLMFNLDSKIDSKVNVSSKKKSKTHKSGGTTSCKSKDKSTQWGNNNFNKLATSVGGDQTIVPYQPLSAHHFSQRAFLLHKATILFIHHHHQHTTPTTTKGPAPFMDTVLHPTTNKATNKVTQEDIPFTPNLRVVWDLAADFPVVPTNIDLG